MCNSQCFQLLDVRSATTAKRSLSLEMPAADKNKVASTRRRSKGKATKLRLPFVGLLFKASYYELLCRVGIEAYIADVRSLCSL